MPDPKFLVVNSNDLTVLGQVCANIIRTEPLSDPLEAEQILVMNLGMKTFLSQCIAQNNGIESRCEYPQVWQLIWSVYRRLYPFIQNKNLYDRRHMTLNIIALREEWSRHSMREFHTLQEYVRHDHDGAKLYELAAKVSDTFDQYQMYRPDWIEFANSLTGEEFDAFDRKNPSGRIYEFFKRESGGSAHNLRNMVDNVWQFRLWTMLKKNLNLEEINKTQGLDTGRLAFYADDRSQILKKLQDDLRDGNPDLDFSRLPKRIFIFGVSALPQQVVELMYRLSSYTKVYLMLLNPCSEYWGDIRSGWKTEFKDFSRRLRVSRLEERLNPGVKLYDNTEAAPFSYDNYDEEDGTLAEGNPLLISFGRQGRDNLFMLLDLEVPPVFINAFVDTQNNTVLTQIQHQLLTLSYSGDKIPVRDDDNSLELHSCHTRRREVEILKDAILSRFREAKERGESLLPRDIVVMVPTINEYAPYISAVFGGMDVDDEHYVPFAVSDRTEQEQNPIADSLLILLSITQKRITNNLIIDLLSVDPIGKRFGIGIDDVRVLEDWIRESNIHWGLDFNEVKEVSEIDLPGTFDRGLERMLYGTMSGDGGENSYAEIEGREDSSLLGRLYNFIRALETLRDAIGRAEDPKDPEGGIDDPNKWGQFLIRNVIDRFYAEDEDQDSRLRVVRETVAQMQIACTDLKFKPRMNLAVFRAMLAQDLEGQRDYTPFLKDKVNFCSLIPMRAVPFRHVFLLGINDMRFPRTERAPAFNLMMMPGMFRKGDRSRTIDDRYLFLEAIMSARQSLYISFLGQSPIDGRKQNPSVAVNELLDYLKDNFTVGEGSGDPERDITERFVVQERMFAYDEQNYIIGAGKNRYARYPSFDRVNFQVDFRHELQDRLGCLGVGQDWGFEPEDNISLDLEGLLSFFRSPCRHFLNNKLNIRLGLNDDAGTLEEDESFGLAYLQKGQLIDSLIRYGDKSMLGIMESKGALPYGMLGSIAGSAVTSGYEAMEETITNNALRPAEGPLELVSHKVSVKLGDRTFTVYLNAALQVPLLCCQAYTHKKSYKPWFRPVEILNSALMSSCAGIASGKRQGVSYVFNDGELVRYPGIPSDMAQQCLEGFVYYYLLGQTMALPVCDGFMRAFDLGGGMDGADFGYDNECRYIYGSVANIVGDEKSMEVANGFFEFYGWLKGAVQSPDTDDENSVGQEA